MTEKMAGPLISSHFLTMTAKVGLILGTWIGGTKNPKCAVRETKLVRISSPMIALGMKIEFTPMRRDKTPIDSFVAGVRGSRASLGGGSLYCGPDEGGPSTYQGCARGSPAQCSD